MSTVWRYTAMILAGAFLLLGTGIFSLRMAHGPRGLRETPEILRKLGGEPGLDARKAQLAGLVARLRLERTAQGADADAFSRRLEEAFAGLGLELAASSDWKPVPKVKLPEAAAFERSFKGTGTFAGLLDAVATIESWPDGARVRSLAVTRQGPGKVAFTLEITAIRAVRTVRSSAGESR